MNLVGPVAAAATFLSIWFGHAAVRKIEFVSRTIWLPAAVFAAGGMAAEWLSLATAFTTASISGGILGITLLWDALEFARQERRVIRGHAPANPLNPRHARILRQFASATTADLLKGEPAIPVHHTEIQS